MISKMGPPNLTERNYRITSPPSLEYNCVAWAAGDTDHWWQPGVYWPTEASGDDYGPGTLEQAFTKRATLGATIIDSNRDLRRLLCIATHPVTLTWRGRFLMGDGRASSAAMQTSSTTDPTI
jgi:hypothetical protein